MPGNVAAAAPTTVLPWSLASRFTRQSEYPLLLAEYRAGECDQSILGEIARNTWELSWEHLTPTEITALFAFYIACNGPLTPFYFYDLTEPNAGTYDPTGASTTSRYTVRFDGEWSQSIQLSMGKVSLRLVEVT
jgi:hypothetical protein